MFRGAAEESESRDNRVRREFAILRKKRFVSPIRRSAGEGPGGRGTARRACERRERCPAPPAPRRADCSDRARGAAQRSRCIHGGGRMVARGNGQPSERTYASLFRAF